MQFKNTLAAMAALSVSAAPAVALSAAANDTPPWEPMASKAAVAHAVAHRKATRRNVRLARLQAHRVGERLPVGYLTHARKRSLEELQRSNQRLRVEVERLRRQTVLVARLRPTLRAIAFCESRHNPHAIGGGGKYRGLFQMDATSWAQAGGQGDPARASVREQYLRAAITYARRGAAPWPVCGR
jgi:Transglycosylase-like domain